MFTSDTINKKIGIYLRDSRIAAGLSQKQVAEKLKYSSPQFVSNFERGLCSPPTKALRVLIRLYDLDIAEFTSRILELQEDFLQDLFGLKSRKKSKKA